MAFIKLTRKELYDRVWAEPMSRLAKGFGMSDVGLAKLCNRFDIPRPPRGYWAKKEFGKAPPISPLPNPNQNEEIELRDPADGEIKSTELRDQVKQIVGQEQWQESPIVVAESLRSAHALVRQANEELQSARTDENGLLVQPKTAGLTVKVSKGNLRRALRIMDAVLKALEDRNYLVASGPTATILDVPVKFCIEEPLSLHQEESDEVELEGSYIFGHSRFKKTLVPSGRLVLRILDAERFWAQGCRKVWRDGDKSKLEIVLNKFVSGLVAFAARVKEHEEAEMRREEERQKEAARREEEAHQRAVQRKKYAAERARFDALMDQSKNWRRSQTLRDYIEAVRQQYLQQFATIEPGSDLANWIEWASQQADRLDPLRQSPPSILDLDPKDLEDPKRSY